MKKLLLVLLPLLLAACSIVPSAPVHKAPIRVGGEIGSYPNNPNPTMFARVLSDDGCPSLNPCTTGTTYGTTLAQIWNYQNELSGTNTNATMLCGTNCFTGPVAGGTANANQINGGFMPSNAALLASDAGGRPVAITTTANGCVGITANQIFTNCVSAPLSTLTNLPACNAAESGYHYNQTDLNSFPPTRGATATGGGTSGSWIVVCQSNAGTYNWVYE